ncbi:hypothetical protein STTU_3577 [Streptomyces sp. Tu6071]|nr:hypothetical protein STTU_3577 [Streptomyces sp. Tu6071]
MDSTGAGAGSADVGAAERPSAADSPAADGSSEGRSRAEAASVDDSPADASSADGSPAGASPSDDSPADPTRANSSPADPTPPNSAPADPASPDSSFGEDELRALFHGAVDGLAPGEGTLDRLQAAVPARRARKRQTLVGVAAAVILLGTAIPAAVHVAAAPGHEADPAMAGSSQDAHTPTSAETKRPKSPEHVEGGGRSASPHSSASGGHRGGASGSPDPETHSSAGTVLAEAPRCEPTQLGDAAADRGTPAADGTVYGSFRVANISGEKCAVTSPGQVQVAVVGGTSRTTVPVVQHQDGDAAGGLPGTSQSVRALLLDPGQSYEVRFAFVPDSTCPTGGPTQGPGDPDPSSPPPVETSQPPAESGGSGAGSTPDNSAALDQTTTQFTRSVPLDDTPATGTVEVTHNAAPGGPVTNTTIPESCPGTVYRTGLLPANGG